MKTASNCSEISATTCFDDIFAEAALKSDWSAMIRQTEEWHAIPCVVQFLSGLCGINRL